MLLLRKTRWVERLGTLLTQVYHSFLPTDPPPTHHVEKGQLLTQFLGYLENEISCLVLSRSAHRGSSVGRRGAIVDAKPGPKDVTSVLSVA